MPTPENLQPIATVVAALVGGGLLLYVHRRAAYRAASVKFRAAVLAALSGLYPHPPTGRATVDPSMKFFAVLSQHCRLPSMSSGFSFRGTASPRLTKRGESTVSAETGENVTCKTIGNIYRITSPA